MLQKAKKVLADHGPHLPRTEEPHHQVAQYHRSTGLAPGERSSETVAETARSISPGVTQVSVGTISQSQEEVAELHEHDRVTREIQYNKGATVNDKVNPDAAEIHTGLLGVDQHQIADVVQTLTKERHVDAITDAVAAHTQHTEPVSVQTGDVKGSKKQLGHMVETITVSRDVRPATSGMSQIPIAAFEEAKRQGVADLYIGMVKQTQRIVGVIVETESTYHTFQHLESKPVAVNSDSSESTIIETGVLDEEKKPVARIVEEQTTEQLLREK